MNEHKAQADLEAKVKELLESLTRVCMNRLDSLRLSGSGIIEDHVRNDCNYLVPKAFLIAVLKSRPGLYSPKAKGLSESYYELM